MAIHTPMHHATAMIMLRILKESTENVVFMQNQGDFWQHHTWAHAANASSKRLTFDDQFTYHYDNDAWRKHISTMDVFVSGRIHGAMMAISAGVPTIIIPNDMRLLELAEVMKLPIVRKPLATDDIYSLIKSITFDGKAFDHNRAQVARKYKQSFDSFGILMNHIVVGLIKEV